MTPPCPTGAPLISIVIPTLNSAALLANGLRSLCEQTMRDFEVIVSDGASSDDTVGVAKRFTACLPALRIDARPDAGVYDAINRGVVLARGRWFLVLGSDDRLHREDTLAAVAPHLEAAGDAQMVYGDVRMLAPQRPRASRGERYAGPMPLKRLFVANVCQQAVFYRRELFDALGGFDLSYPVCADWDFNLRAVFRAPARWVDIVIADYAATGISATRADTAFHAQLPGMIRAELERRASEPDSWPLQDHLLRCANRFRRRGQWAEAFGYVGSYLHLVARRVPVLLGAQPAGAGPP